MDREKSHFKSGAFRALASGTIALTLTSGMVLANPDPPPRAITTPLFSIEPTATVMLSTGVAPSTVAIDRRVVTIDPATLGSLAEDGAATLTIDLPGMGEVIIDIRRHIHHRGGDIGIIGRVRGEARSRVVLEIGEGLLVGDIIRGHDMVQIRQVPEGAFDVLGHRAKDLHLVQSVREQSGAVCGNDLYDVAVPPDPHAKPPSIWGGHANDRHDDDGGNDDARNPYVDVMIVYTDGARAAIGGTGAARLLGHLTIDTANEIYSDSDVDHRLRMARMYEVDYDETGGTHNDHLDAITDEDDVIDGVHTVREQVGADLVTFMIDDLDPGVGCGTCVTYGLGWRPITESTSNADIGFHTCHWENMATPTWSMPHEAGHNMGAYHDDLSIPGSYLALYGCGHYWNNVDGNRERSIMGRNALGGTRIPYFSNPGIDFNGNATGDATHDCSRMFDEVSDTISDYVSASSTTQYVDTNWTGSEDGSSSNPWDTFWEGYINVRWGGTVIMKNCEDDNMNGPIRGMLIKSTGGSSIFR
ncbi:MAG TPA: hypothetical protein DGN59_23020 [Candidatus Latescibacteria bacterium]|nr:hypothetical protein [Candidatus Latescibacterota bacterium]